MRELHHGTVVTVGRHAALIRGPSGSGKSDLALRCIAHPPGGLIAEQARLIADDQVWLERQRESLIASAPDTIRGFIEIRGIGIVSVPFSKSAELALVVDLVATSRIERLPDPVPHTQILGIGLPLLNISPFEASAALKVLLALNRASAAQ